MRTSGRVRGGHRSQHPPAAQRPQQHASSGSPPTRRPTHLLLKAAEPDGQRQAAHGGAHVVGSCQQLRRHSPHRRVVDGHVLRMKGGHHGAGAAEGKQPSTCALVEHYVG